MITTQWNSNFSNNMFQYAVLYAVSKKTGFQLTTNGWHGRSNDNVSPGNGKELFNLIEEPDFNEYIETEVFRDSHCTDQSFNENIFKIKDGTKLDGYFQTDKYFIDYRNDILKMFTFKDTSIKENAKNIISSINKQIVVCIHSREGDYVGDEGFSVMDENYFKPALEKIINELQCNIHDIGVVVISDNRETNKLNFLKDMNVPFIISQENKFIDLCIMKYADHCITSASSFSWWGAWLNEKDPIIISPNFWINYNRSGPWSPKDINMTNTNQFFIDMERNIC